MTALWYWLMFAVCVALFAAVPVAAWYERRADERDREARSRMPGAR